MQQRRRRRLLRLLMPIIRTIACILTLTPSTILIPSIIRTRSRSRIHTLSIPTTLTLMRTAPTWPHLLQMGMLTLIGRCTKQ